MINTTMTKENVDFIVDNFGGDFIGFQSYYESLQVSLILSTSLGFSVWVLMLSRIGSSRGCPLNPRWVSTL